MTDQIDINVPTANPQYVPDGFFEELKIIFNSKLFYPVFITGPSGNGKTESVEQAAAAMNRTFMRVNLTVETDESDLIGGMRLINGETVYQKGPVIRAMEEGTVLLLDEIDLASTTRIMCLQSIMEGKPYFIKKTGELIKPKHGFTIVATANTKGKGSANGRFMGTNILNEAFLERFSITYEHSYPSKKVELAILGNYAKEYGIKQFHDKKIDHGMDVILDCLVKWGDGTRKTFDNGGSEELISTRRLIHILKAISIFQDFWKAVELCVARFDDAEKKGMLEALRVIIPPPKSAGDDGKSASNLELKTEGDILNFIQSAISATEAAKGKTP